MDFLESLAWDGQDHIATLSGYFTDKHSIFPKLLRYWLVGAVARVYTGGRQNRVLVLEGAQNLGKSYFARWLAAPILSYFSEAIPNPDDKDSRLALATTWIWEIKELGSVTRRADREALKNFITTRIVTLRKAYGKYGCLKQSSPGTLKFMGNQTTRGFFRQGAATRFRVQI